VKHKILLGLLAVILAMPSMAQASITNMFDTSGLVNKIKFTNYESFIRANPNGGWSVIAPVNVLTGDQLMSIFSATELTIQSAPGSGVFGPVPAWQKGNNDYFLGYSVADVTVVPGGGGALTYSNPTYDPFGKLALNTEMVWLGESRTDWNVTGLIVPDVASIFVNATQWATFGIVNKPNGGSFSPLPPVFGTLIGVSAFGLDQVQAPGGGWPGFDKTKAFGNDIFGGANIYVPGQDEEWVARSEDPITFAAVPEPATLAMWGGFLAIGAVIALRRRQK
jgi:hypothetical protein